MKFGIAHVLAAFASLLIAIPVQAGVFTWTDVDGDWSVANNWGEAAAPTGVDNTDVLYFGGSGASAYVANNDNPGTFVLNQIVLTNGATVAQTITGNLIQFSGAGAGVSQNTSPSVTMQNDLELATTTTFSGASSGTLTLSGVINGSGPLVKSGGTRVNVTGNNTYSGGTQVNGGILTVNNTAGSGTGSGSVTVNSSGLLRGTGTIAGNVIVNSGGQISGTLKTGALTINSGGILAPGTSPGTIKSGNATLNGGGIYLWDVADFRGSAGSGWDLLSVTGTLDLNATSADRFIIKITGTPGSYGGTIHGLTLASATGGILDFDPTFFTIDTTGFAGAPGYWTLGVNGNNLALDFTVPEPSMVVLWGIGLALFGGRYILRRRATA